jgi:hypothetical protein
VLPGTDFFYFPLDPAKRVRGSRPRGGGGSGGGGGDKGDYKGKVRERAEGGKERCHFARLHPEIEAPIEYGSLGRRRGG